MNKIIPAILNINVDAGGLFPYTGDTAFIDCLTKGGLP